MIRYSAKLLFQYRVSTPKGDGRMRTCEERIVTFEARGDRAGLRKAKALGKAAQYHFKNTGGNPVRFEFVGIMDMIKLDPVCEPHEVWYEIRTCRQPMERKGILIPNDDKLLENL